MNKEYGYISLVERVKYWQGWELTPEARTAVLKVEKAGFYWQAWRLGDRGTDSYMVAIRLKLNMWSVFDTEANDLSKAVLGAYKKAIAILPGIHYQVSD